MASDYETVVASCTRLSNSNARFAATRASALVNRGRAQAHQKRHEAAIVDYDLAIAMAPAYHRAYYRKALALVHLGQREQAIPLLNRAIDLQPSYYDAQELRGWLHMELGDYWMAAIDYAEATRIAPHDKDTRLKYEWNVWRAAKAHREEGKPFDADRLIAILPNDSYGYMARARQPQVDHAQRLADVDRAIALGYRDPEWYLWRSVVRNSQGDKAGALADMAAALEIANKDTTAKGDAARADSRR